MGSYHPALTDPNWVHDFIVPELPAAVDKALAAGAHPPMEYLGAGVQGIVLADSSGLAYKVGRRDYRLLIEDFEWLAFARTVPAIASHVVRVLAYDDERDVIVMEALQSRPKKYGTYGGDSRLFELHQRICRVMLEWGFGCPEFKTDAYIYVAGRGPVLVDAGFAGNRFGWRLARAAQKVLSGVTPLPTGYDFDHLVFSLQSDASDGRLPRDVANRLVEALVRIEGR